MNKIINGHTENMARSTIWQIDDYKVQNVMAMSNYLFTISNNEMLVIQCCDIASSINKLSLQFSK